MATKYIYLETMMVVAHTRDNQTSPPLISLNIRRVNGRTTGLPFADCKELEKKTDVHNNFGLLDTVL